MRKRPGARAVITAVGLLGATAAVMVTSASPVSSQDGPAPGLDLVDQTFAVAPGSLAHFEFVVTADVPEITTTTTTTTTTTPVVPTTVPLADQTDEESDSVPVPASTVTASDTPSTEETEPEEGRSDSAAEVIVQVRAHPVVESRADIADSLDGSLAAPIDLVEFELAAVASVAADGSERIVLDVPIDDFVRFDEVSLERDELDLPEPGIYPITVQIRRGGRPIVSHTTFIERLRTEGVGRGPFSMVVVARVDDAGTIPTDESLAGTREQLTQLAQLAESTTAPLAVALPPTATAQIVESDPELAGRLRAALAGDTVLAQPDAPLDPTAALLAGIRDEFVRRLGEGERQIIAALPGVSSQRGAWLAHASLTADSAQMLHDLGAQLLVLPYDTYTGLTGSLDDFTDTSLLLNADLPGETPIPVAVVDPGLDMLAIDPGRINTPTEDAVRVLAEIGAMRTQLDPDRRSLVLAAPGFGVPDAGVLAALERLVAGHPEVRFQPLTSLTGLTNSFFIDGEPVTIDLPAAVSTPMSTSLIARVERVNDIRLLAGGAASMLPAGDARPEGWQSTLQSLLTTGITDADGTVAIDTLDAEVDELLNAVEPPDPFPFTIGGRSVDLPIKITNNSPTPLTVIVRLESDKLTFPENDVPVVLAPNAVTDILIEVAARSNGVFPVRVELLTPAGSKLTDPVEFTARVNNLTGLGRLLTVGGALVLATWWLTYFTRRRRAARDQGVGVSRDRHPANAQTGATE